MGTIFDVKRVSDKIMLVKLVVGKSTVTVLLVYAPQAGLGDSVKDLFYENLHWTLTKISASDILFLWGFQGHIGRMQMGMREFMLVEGLEDVIWRVREFLNLLLHKFTKGRVIW